MRPSPLILIVEDNPASREIMQKRLEAQGYSTIIAGDGLEGLDMARENKPDLILLDILMPKMDGLEVCRRLKSDQDLSFIPIIFVSAKSDSRDVVSGLEIGGDEYLAKPVNHTALVARVKSMLRIKELHDTVLDQSARLERQLKTATTIQSLFWPRIPEPGYGSHIWAISLPAAYVGGDLYDILQMSDESLLTYVADVSDKGVPAALIMAALTTKIRSEVQSCEDPRKLLSIVNETLYNLTSDQGYFATMLLARYWPSNGKLQMIRAGHLHPLWVSSGTIKELPPMDGVSLGITPDAHFESREIILGPQESILLFTDGVSEAANKDNELFGIRRLSDHVLKSPGPPWGKGLLEEVKKWRGNIAANDDLTILEIWRT